ncbi:guanylate kinase [Aequitasia blattaphilus]|uniref:Guanylate kinase n=1 Tax=Aequitasia blattaphilus TaxID=2949332 RepID=A0ABT1E9F5_9FIRM|nr:guanylate kinase [Aequitasia blattaphilus]MCP1102466.1 guanylate kinase [Aequitasia blattaphilus]MCR8615106.1 guanylate kinase [Aequitasia blattaphilus]
MNKLFYIMGKSATGKDSLYKHIKEEIPSLKTVVPYTTRPIREGEKDGEEYYFVTEEDFKKFKEEGRMIEQRAYHTVHGVWRYATVDDGQIDLNKGNYLMIGTLESYQKMKEYYGEKNILPLYIEVEDGERLIRSIEREKRQNVPKYAETCRRFLADEQDFSKENLEQAGITRKFTNDNIRKVLDEITEVIVNGEL